MATTAHHGLDLETLRQEPTLQEGHLVEILRSLVNVKSVNPGVYEKQLAERIGRWLEGICTVSFVESMPGRPSVAAVLEGAGQGPRLVLNGHMDTVAVDDLMLWTTDPFHAHVRDGYLYGRGACDMKGGLTAQIAVAQFLAQRHEKVSGSLVLHFAAGEECAEPGTLSLLQAGFVGDVGIVTEPTQLKVATAERGTAFYRIRIKGRSIHASRAHLGINPIPRLRGVLDTIGAYEAEVKKRQHPLLPGGSCTPTIVRAGVKENAVPDYCELVLDRRLLPGESVDREMGALQERLSALRSADSDFDFDIAKFPNSFEPAEIDSSSPFARQVAQVVEQVTESPCEFYGTPYSSDVRNLVNDAGMEAITFGPGNVAECHCVDERLSLRELRDAALALTMVAGNLLLQP